MMAMGFDLKDCQDAINFGKTSVEAAVEWIVAGKPGLVANVGGSVASEPRLTLRQTNSAFINDSSFAAFHKPHPIPESTAATSDQSDAFKSNQREEADVTSQSAEASSSTDQSEDSGIISRMHMSDTQRQYRQRFEQKKMDKAKKQVVQEKRKQKEEHSRILKEIAEDREKKKLITHAPTHSDESQASHRSEQGKGSVTLVTSTSQAATSRECLLQIRLPDGRSLRTSFNPDATLQDAWTFAAVDKYPRSTFSFIQPFPRHEFSREEMTKSLAELGLTPTGSLVIQKTQAHTESTANSGLTEPMESTSSPQNPAISPHRVPPMFDVLQPPTHVSPAPRGHNWGQGFAVNQEPTVNDLDEDEPMEEEEGPPIPDPALGLGGHHFPQPPPDVMGGMEQMLGMMGGGAGYHGAGGNQQVFGGVGQRLVPEGHPGHGTGYQQRSSRHLALEHAQARQAHPPPGQGQGHGAGQQPGTSLSGHTPATQHQVPTLLQLALKHVAARLNDPRHQILSLAGIPEEMAQIILGFLIKEKLLKPKTLNAFIPCYLLKLILDCYPYTTNEVLHSIRLHTHLRHLSLSSCPLITDQGLNCLNSLKKLRRLNISCCPQLTNKCLSSLYNMPELTLLNLEQTGITDSGIIEYLDSKPPCLQHLVLNRTSATQAIFSHIHTGVPHLKILSLEGSEVSDLQGVEGCRDLESLNISNTAVTNESLRFLAQLSSLTSLNVANTEEVNGDTCLKELQGLKLLTLVLPSRHTTTNSGMQYITGFSLVSLDLTNYINIGDEGMEYVTRVKSLKKLILSNTKVTDKGMLYLENLRNLEILHLDRCLITDQGASIIGELKNLMELSLASTGITSKFLLTGRCNSCVNLSKLNLSRTMVTKRGVLALSLPFLQMLNLDGTKVTPDLGVVMVQGCPKLTQMLMRNLQPFTRNDELEEAEMMEM
ncbi:uncharacterized protein LOC127854414 isoform X2 [Dreissena polymorpha]|nr:uncharacterized protein LOC127854414 isoform X2 [Dreissena polymorpha]XP_052245397.1 uncharacterized protein LOC127854414 isoform X2 [Dreissena polymorpha]